MKTINQQTTSRKMQPGRRIALAAGLSACLSAAALPSARATLLTPMVTHSTGGVLINDSFESPDTPPNQPIGWTSTGAGGNLPSVENAGTAAGNPAAYEGSQYLALRRQPDSARQTFGPFTSGIITANFAFYIPDVATDREHAPSIFPEFLKSDGPGFANSAEWIGFAHNDFVNGFTGSTIGAGLGGVYYLSGYPVGGQYALTAGGSTFTFALNAWHRATIAYDIAAVGSTTAFAITIDGVRLDALPAANTLATGTIVGFQFFNNTAGSAADFPGFVDALPIPEPSTVFLFGVGGLLAWRRRRTAA